MSEVANWSPIDENNNLPPPDGWPEFMMPSQVNNCARGMMGAIRRHHDQMVAGSFALPYLPIAGGTVTGSLGVNGSLTVGGAISCSTTIYSASTISTNGHLSTGLNVYAAGSIQGAYLYSSGSGDCVGSFGANSIRTYEYNLGGAVFATRGSPYTTLFDAASVPVLQFNNGTGVNYHFNWGHYFNSRDGVTSYVTINSGGLNVATGNLVVSAGGLWINGGNPLTVTGNATVNGALNAGSATISSLTAGNAQVNGTLNAAAVTSSSATFGSATVNGNLWVGNGTINADKLIANHLQTWYEATINGGITAANGISLNSGNFYANAGEVHASGNMITGGLRFGNESGWFKTFCGLLCDNLQIISNNFWLNNLHATNNSGWWNFDNPVYSASDIAANGVFLFGWGGSRGRLSSDGGTISADRQFYAPGQIWTGQTRMTYNGMVYLGGDVAIAFVMDKSPEPGWSNLHVYYDGNYFWTINKNVMSDERLKTNIARSEIDALGLLRQLDMISFDMRGRHHELGVRAQQLDELLPDCVTKGPPAGEGVPIGDLMQVNSDALSTYLLRALQQLAAKVEQLEAEVSHV